MISVTELAETLARNFWRIAGVFLLVTGVAAYVLFRAPDVYEARTLLLYKLGRDYIYVPEVAESGARAPDPGDLQLVVNAEMQILNSARLKWEVVERIGPAEIYPDLAGHPEAQELAFAALEDAVSISLITGSYVVRLGVHHVDPQMAAELADQIVRSYLVRRAEVFRTADAESLREQIRAAEEAIEETKAEIVDLLGGRDTLTFETDRDVVVAEQGRLRQRLVEIEAELAGLAERRARVLEELDGLDPMVVDASETHANPVIGNVRAALLALEAERRAQAGQVGASHPTVVALEREIAALEEIAEGEPLEIRALERSSANPLRLQASSELLDLRLSEASRNSERNFLIDRIEANDGRIAELSRVGDSLALLRATLSRQQDQAAELFLQLQEVQIASSVEGDLANIRIIEPATPPTRPVGAPKSVRAMIAVALGGVAAAGWTLALLFLGGRVSSAHAAERRLGLPALGEVSLRGRREFSSSVSA